jgi:hypothetical protein
MLVRRFTVPNPTFSKLSKRLLQPKNALLSREKEHSTQFTVMEKVTEETLERFL